MIIKSIQTSFKFAKNKYVDLSLLLIFLISYFFFLSYIEEIIRPELPYTSFEIYLIQIRPLAFQLLRYFALVPILYVLSRSIIMGQLVKLSDFFHKMRRSYFTTYWVLFILLIITVSLNYFYLELIRMIGLDKEIFELSKFLDYGADFSWYGTIQFYFALYINALPITLLQLLLKTLFFVAPVLASVGKKWPLILSIQLVKGHFWRLYLFLFSCSAVFFIFIDPLYVMITYSLGIKDFMNFLFGLTIDAIASPIYNFVSDVMRAAKYIVIYIFAAAYCKELITEHTQIK